MTLTQADAFIAALERAKFSPTREAEYDGKKIHYRSLAEIDNALSSLRAERATLTGATAPRVLRFRLGNGLGRSPQLQ